MLRIVNIKPNMSLNKIKISFIVTALIAVGFWFGILYSKSTESDWGGYWSTRMEIYKFLKSGDNKSMRLAADKNLEYFDRLKSSGELIGISYKIEEVQDFMKDNERFMMYRGGMSIEGGQWPPGHEYVDKYTYELVNKKYKDK